MPSSTSPPSLAAVSSSFWKSPSLKVLAIWIESASLPPASDTWAFITTVGPLRWSSRIRNRNRPPSALPVPSATGAVSPTVAAGVGVSSAPASAVALSVGAVVAACRSSPLSERAASSVAYMGGDGLESSHGDERYPTRAALTLNASRSAPPTAATASRAGAATASQRKTRGSSPAAHQLYRHAGVAQRGGVGLALVAQDVLLGGEDVRGRCAASPARSGEASGWAPSAPSR